MRICLKNVLKIIFILLFSKYIKIIPKIICMWYAKFFLDLIILIGDGALFKLTETVVLKYALLYMHVCVGNSPLLC